MRLPEILQLSILLTLLAPPTALALPLSAPPDQRPDRVILTWSADPTRTQSVTWRTPYAGSQVEQFQPCAQIAPALPGPKLLAQATTVTATSQAVETTRGTTHHYHTANFINLEPSTKYAYRVGDPALQNWSEWNHFTTAAATPEPFSFLYVGDAQNDVLSLWSRVIRDGYRRGAAGDLRFLLHAGDLIDRANNDQEWGEWFEAAGWIHRTTPSIATPGNHEYSRLRGDATSTLSKLWRPQFEFPTNGPEGAGLDETAYYLDYQGVRIVSLNSNEKIALQTPWLDKVLTDNPNKWTILTFHHPIYSAAARRDNPHIRAAWMPLIDKHKVDLVLQGHDHTYGRTQALTSGTVVGETGGGTVYVVSVSGPKLYDVTTASKHLMARVAEDTQLFQLIRVDGDRLNYEAFTAAGDLYDALEIVKRPNQPNELINKIPNTPDRRRKLAVPEED